MTIIRAQLRPALTLLLVLTAITGLLYPLATLGLGQVLFADQANGSVLTRADGSVEGSALIGQQFTSTKYFHPRPSATLSTDPTPVPAPYNAANSGASNLGPTNHDYLQLVQQRATQYRVDNNLPADMPVPADAVTASGSGLDPDISPANASLQAARVAQARGVPVATVMALIEQHTSGRTLGILGEPRVNVLLLNLALDATK